MIYDLLVKQIVFHGTCKAKRDSSSQVQIIDCSIGAGEIKVRWLLTV